MNMTAAQLVERFYHEVWNCADERVAYAILHPDFRFRGSLGPEKHGPDGFIAYMRQIHAALAGYTCTIEAIVEQGEHAAVRLRFSGAHQGLFFGVPPSGRQITWSGAAFFETGEGQITRLWVLGDIDPVKQQLALPGSTSIGP